MKSIKEVIVAESIIKKSKFINYLIPVADILEVEKHLLSLKEKYQGANHHTYAYVIGKNQELQKYSDDGEPNKTAGFPMMEVIKKNDLTNVLNVSIRYFGGIKLGAGGLTRAYTKGCSIAISKAKYSYLTNYSEITVKIPFDKIGKVEKYIRDNYFIQKTEYNELVNYFVVIKTDDLMAFKIIIKDLTKGIAIIDLLKSYDKYE